MSELKLTPLSSELELDELCEFIRRHNASNYCFEEVRCPQGKNEFRNWFMQVYPGFKDFRLIRQDGVITGYISACDFRLIDRHCRLSFWNVSSDMDKAVKEYLLFLYNEYPLRKVFFRCSDCRKEKLQTAYSIGFYDELVLPNYTYIEDSNFYDDMHILSINLKEFADFLNSEHTSN